MPEEATTQGFVQLTPAFYLLHRRPASVTRAGNALGSGDGRVHLEAQAHEVLARWDLPTSKAFLFSCGHGGSQGGAGTMARRFDTVPDQIPRAGRYKAQRKLGPHGRPSMVTVAPWASTMRRTTRPAISDRSSTTGNRVPSDACHKILTALCGSNIPKKVLHRHSASSQVHKRGEANHCPHSVSCKQPFSLA